MINTLRIFPTSLMLIKSLKSDNALPPMSARLSNLNLSPPPNKFDLSIFN